MSKLENIEDWKNSDKIDAIKKLIDSGHINQHNIGSFLGHKSKKTYSNGDVIDDTSLALKKFMNPEIKEYINSFYNIIDNTVKPELIEDINNIVKVINSMIVCKDKYNMGTLETYKSRIEDIIYTRDIEESLYMMFYRKSYNKLISDPQHIALKFILYNSWENTMTEYTWLTKLITFVNNGSMDAKQFLLNIGVKDSKNVNDIIADTCKIMKLNMKYINVIISFIHSIGQYFKHGTYIKWYNKELNNIKIFIENKDNTIENMIKDYDMNVKEILTDYYNKLKDLYHK
jgi:hypothetical protein